MMKLRYTLSLAAAGILLYSGVACGVLGRGNNDERLLSELPVAMDVNKDGIADPVEIRQALGEIGFSGTLFGLERYKLRIGGRVVSVVYDKDKDTYHIEIPREKAEFLIKSRQKEPQ